MKVIAIANQKGGVAKTTTALNMAAGLREHGKTVLLIDLDAQANLSGTLNALRVPLNSMDVLSGTAKITEAIVGTPEGDLLPAGPSLSIADNMLTATGKEYRLKEALEPVRGKYDYCIIDCPPNLGVLCINALTVAHEVIIPTGADYYSLQSIGMLNSTVEQIRRYTNPKLKIAGILLTRHNNRTVLARDMRDNLEELAGQLRTKVFKTFIRESVSIKEAQALHASVLNAKSASAGAGDYRAFVNEYLGKE